jgi:hypothetical protein
MRKFVPTKAFLAVAVMLARPAVPVLASSDPKPPELRLPPVAEPVEYAVDLTIDPGNPTLHGIVDVAARVKAPTELLWLNAAGLKIDRLLAPRGAGRSRSAWSRAVRTSWASPSTAASHRAS